MENVMGNNQLLLWGAKLSMPIASSSPHLTKKQIYDKKWWLENPEKSKEYRLKHIDKIKVNNKNT